MVMSERMRRENKEVTNRIAGGFEWDKGNGHCRIWCVNFLPLLEREWIWVGWIVKERHKGVFGSFGFYGKEKLGMFERGTGNVSKREWNCLKGQL